MSVSKIVLTGSTYQTFHLWLLIAVYRNWLFKGKKSGCPPVTKASVDILQQAFVHSPQLIMQELAILEPTIRKIVWRFLQFKCYIFKHFQLIPMPVLSVLQFVLQ